MSEADATVKISCAQEFNDGSAIVISDSPVSARVFQSIMHTFTDPDTRSAALMVASLAETNRRLRADLDDRLAAVVRAERLADSYRRERDEAVRRNNSSVHYTAYSKACCEIEVLKLEIAELKKGNDDFSKYSSLNKEIAMLRAIIHNAKIELSEYDNPIRSTKSCETD